MDSRTLSYVMNDVLSEEEYFLLTPMFNKAMLMAECNTVKRAAMWCAQIGTESQGLLYMEELASGAAYEGRKDLGNVNPGDGVRYKGRGPIQITGRANYAALSSWAFYRGNVPSATFFLDNPEALSTNQYGFLGAVWYWYQRDLNKFADAKDINGATLAVNGGLAGIADRSSRWAKALAVGDEILPDSKLIIDTGGTNMPASGFQYFRGFLACDCLAEWLVIYEKLLLHKAMIRANIDIFQLVGGYVLSGGTHLPGGAYDIGQCSQAEVSLARQMGAAGFRRTPPAFSYHQHGVLNGCPHNSGGRYQITELANGGDGLMGSAPDNNGTKVTRNWREGIAWAKAQMSSDPLTPTPAPGDNLEGLFDMTEIVKFDRTKDIKLTPGKWQWLPIDDAGHASLVGGPTDFDGQIIFGIDGLPVGKGMWVQFYLVSFKKDGKTGVQDFAYPAMRIDANANNTVTLKDRISGPSSKYASRRLRARVYCGTKGVTLTRVYSRFFHS